MSRLAPWSQRKQLLILLLVLLWLRQGLSVRAEQDQVGGSFSVVRSDLTPPTRINDLAVVQASTTSLSLTWSAPSDAVPPGRAARYDLRYALTPIVTWSDWLKATRILATPRPGVPEARERLTLQGLEPDTQYYFVITSVDVADNWAALSPCAQGLTLPLLGKEAGYSLAIPIVYSAPRLAAPQSLPLIVQP